MNELIKNCIYWIGLSTIVYIPAIPPSFATDLDFNQLLMDFNNQNEEEQTNFDNKFAKDRLTVQDFIEISQTPNFENLFSSMMNSSSYKPMILNFIFESISNNDVSLRDKIIIMTKTINYLYNENNISINQKAISGIVLTIINNLDHMDIVEAIKEHQQEICLLFKAFYNFNNESNQFPAPNILENRNRDEFTEKGLDWLYNCIEENYYNSQLKAQDTALPLRLDYLNKLFPSLYRLNFHEFAKIFISDLPGSNIEEQNIHKYLSPEEINLSKIIYNQEGGYDKDVPNLPQEGTTAFKAPVLKGNNLILEAGDVIKDASTLEEETNTKNTPIGYYIYLPKGPINGVLVHTYGGTQSKDRVTDLYTPFQITPLDKYLLNQGIAVVQLNLVDLLELNEFQGLMSEDIQDRLHASINKFYQTLRDHPENFSQDFRILENVKIILFGASFGGRTAVRHAEIYPSTFDGYISHDGALSSNMITKSTLFREPSLNKYLSPKNEGDGTENKNESTPKEIDPKISHIKEPILLLHNFDDHKVNIKVTLDFYNEAIKSGKSDLTQLYITRRGNPLKNGDFSFKGHFLTPEDEAFKSYAQTIASFIIEGPSHFPAASKWMAHQYEIYANKNYKSATLQERFVSEAFRLYKSPYRVLDQLRKSKNMSAQNNNIKFEQDWDNIYRDLFFLLGYMEKLKTNDQALQEEINFIKDSGLLTNEAVENAIVTHLPYFGTYLREKFNYILPYDMDLSTLARNEATQAVFRDLLFIGPASSMLGSAKGKAYLVNAIYKGNPVLLKQRLPQLINENKITISEQDLVDAKENLRLRIQEDQEYFKDVARESILKQKMPPL